MDLPHDVEDLLDTSPHDPSPSGAPSPPHRQTVAHSSTFTAPVLHFNENHRRLNESDRLISPTITQDMSVPPGAARPGEPRDWIRNGAENRDGVMGPMPARHDSEDDKKSDRSPAEDDVPGQDRHENLGHAQPFDQVPVSQESKPKSSDSTTPAIWTGNTNEDVEKHCEVTYTEDGFQGKKRRSDRSITSGKRRRLDGNGARPSLLETGRRNDFLSNGCDTEYRTPDEETGLNGQENSIQDAQALDQVHASPQSRPESSDKIKRVFWSGTTNKKAAKYCRNSNPEPPFRRKRDSEESSTSSKRRRLDEDSPNADPWEAGQYEDFLFNVCGTGQMLNNDSKDEFKLDDTGCDFGLNPLALNFCASSGGN